AIVVAFTAAVACAALPALQLWRGDARGALSEVGSGGDSSIEAAGVRKALAIVQISIACALLVAAGLLIRSFVQVLDVKLGFEPEHAVAWRLNSARDLRR